MNDAQILATAFEALSRGEPALAERWIEQRWPSNLPAKALQLRGMCRRTLGLLDDAERDLRAALAKSPEDAEIHNTLGSFYLAAGLRHAARGCLNEAVRLAPGNRSMRFNLARALLLAGDWVDAEEILEALWREQPTNDVARWLGHALSRQRRHDEALALLRKALSSSPGDTGLADATAEALLRAGEDEEAIGHWRILAEREAPRNITFARKHGAALAHVGRWDEAHAVLESALIRAPEDPLLHIDLARMRWLQGVNADEFARCLIDAIARFPHNVHLAAACADLLERAGRPERAEIVVRNALARTPDAAPLLRMLGLLLSERGAISEAIVVLSRARSLSSSDDLLKLLAHAHLRAGDAALARPLIEAGLQIAPYDQTWLAYRFLERRLNNQLDVPAEVTSLVHVVDLPPPKGWESVETFNAALAERLDRLHQGTAHPLDQTLRNGTQTSRDLTEVQDQVIQAFLGSALQAAANFAEGMPHQSSHPFYGRRRGGVDFAGAWSVRLRSGGRHVNHIHGAGWISSAYYVRLPQMCADDERRAGWLSFGEPRLPVPDCGPVFWVEPKVGRLVLFPSYLWHGTQPFSQGDRLTVAFDCVPVNARY